MHHSYSPQLSYSQINVATTTNAPAAKCDLKSVISFLQEKVRSAAETHARMSKVCTEHLKKDN